MLEEGYVGLSVFTYKKIDVLLRFGKPHDTACETCEYWGKGCISQGRENMDYRYVGCLCIIVYPTIQ